MNEETLSPLGKATAYADQYDPSLLFPLPRAPKRAEIGAGRAPFFGADLWTAYELSWLNPRGKPQVALAHITVPCESTHIVESKSFKLYLNSFNGTRFAAPADVLARLRADLSEAVWRGGPVQSSVGVRLVLPEQFGAERLTEFDGLSLDRLDIECHDRKQHVDADNRSVPVRIKILLRPRSGDQEHHGSHLGLYQYSSRCQRPAIEVLA